MRTSSILVTLLLAAPALAWADPCDSAGLSGKYLDACKSALSKCDGVGPARKMCEGRAVSASRLAQQRDEVNDPTSKGGDAAYCAGAEYNDECKAIKKEAHRVCLGDAYGDLDKPEDLESWLERLAAYRAVTPRVKAFWDKNAKCDKAPQRDCTLVGVAEMCRDMEQKYAAGWRARHDNFKTRTMEMLRHDVKAAGRNPTVKQNAVINTVVRQAKHFRMLVEKNTWLGIPLEEAAGVEREVNALAGEAQAAVDQTIASKKCPAASNKDASLTKLTRASLLADWEKEKATRTIKVTLKQFGLTGQPRQSRDLRTLHEDLPAVACVLQEGGPNGTECRILQLTFRRSKPDGGSWGPWGPYSVGGGDLMSCGNL